jgi:hypothetical protein
MIFSSVPQPLRVIADCLRRSMTTPFAKRSSTQLPSFEKIVFRLPNDAAYQHEFVDYPTHRFHDLFNDGLVIVEEGNVWLEL